MEVFVEILQSLNYEQLIIKLNTPAKAVTIEPDEVNNTIANYAYHVNR